MPVPFKVVVNIDIRDPTPDWEPYRQPVAPAETSPWALAGSTISRVFVDVSGEPFIDLAAEAAMLFARE